MPQLDFSVFPSQLFWLMISFFLMLFIMGKFIIPKTAEMINLRKEKIDSDLEKASEIKLKVEETLNKYNKALHDANAKASLTLQKNREELENIVSKRQYDLMQRLKSEIDASEQKIMRSKNKAMDGIENLSVELAIDVLAKLGFSGIKVKDAKHAMESLKEEQ